MEFKIGTGCDSSVCKSKCDQSLFANVSNIDLGIESLVSATLAVASVEKCVVAFASLVSPSTIICVVSFCSAVQN